MTSLTQRDLWVVREALRRYSTAEPDMASTAQRLAERFNAELHARLDAGPVSPPLEKPSIPVQPEPGEAAAASGEKAVLERLATALDSVVVSQAQVNAALSDVLTALQARPGGQKQIPVQG